jgi:hypothetical protein
MTGYTERQKPQAGFAHLVVFLMLALVIGVVAFTGYKLYANKPDVVASDTSAQPKRELSAADAPSIKTTNDLDTASATLDKVSSSSDNSDLQQLDGQLDDIQ